MRVESVGPLEHQHADIVGSPLGKWVAKVSAIFARAINGNLTFGRLSAAGSAPDNIAGKWMTYSTNGVANTEDTITHNLGAVPVGFLLMVPPQAGFIYSGTTAWTSTAIYLKCSAATQTAVIFLLLPPKT